MTNESTPPQSTVERARATALPDASSMLDASLVATALLRADGEDEWTNPAWRRLDPSVREEIARSVAAGADAAPGTPRVVAALGANGLRLFDLLVTPIPDAGDPLALVQTHPRPEAGRSIIARMLDRVPAAWFIAADDPRHGFRFLGVGPQLAAMLGIDPGSLPTDARPVDPGLIAQPIFDTDVVEFFGSLEEAVEQGRPWRTTVRIQHAAGPRWMRFESVVHDQGDVREWHGLVRDVTDERRDRAGLTGRIASDGIAFDVAGIGTWAWDLRSGVQEWSGRTVVELGRSPAAGEASDAPEVPPIESLVHPHDRERVLGAIHRGLDDGATVSEVCRLERPDGSWWTVRLRARARRDDDGQPVAMAGVIDDAGEVLGPQTVVRRLVAAAEVAGSAILVERVEPDGRGTIERVTGPFARLVGRDADRLVGRATAEVLGATPIEAGSDAAHEVVVHAAAGDHRATAYCHHDDDADDPSSPHWRAWSVARVVGSSGIAPAADAMTNIERDAILADIVVEAEAACRSRGELLEALDRRVRTPLHALLGSLDLLDASALDEPAQPFAQAARESSVALLAAVEDLVSLAAGVEGGERRRTGQPFALAPMLERAADEALAESGRRGRVLVVPDPALPVEGTADEERLRRVIANVVADRLAGAATVVLRVRAEGGPEGTVLEIEVRPLESRPVVAGCGDERLDEPELRRSLARRILAGLGGTIDGPDAGGALATTRIHCPLVDPTPPSVVPDDAFPEVPPPVVVVVGDGPVASVLGELASLGGCPVVAASDDGGLPPDVDASVAVRVAAPEPEAGVAFTLRPIGRGREDDGDVRPPDALSPERLRAEVERAIGDVDEGAGAAPPLAGRRVLVAEDHAVNRMIVTSMLEALGADVHAVADGVDAANAVFADDYDAVLMDCMMPRMDGIEAARLVRRRERLGRRHRTPIVALTGAEAEASRDACLEAGMDDVLSKPVDADGLACVVERVIVRAETEALLDETDEVPPGAADDAGGSRLDAIAADLQELLDLVTEGLVGRSLRSGERAAAELRRRALDHGLETVGRTAGRVADAIGREDVDEAVRLLETLRTSMDASIGGMTRR